MSVIKLSIPNNAAPPRTEPRQRPIDMWRDEDLELTLVQNADGSYEVRTRCLMTGQWLAPRRLYL
ncbi:MAG: hypothetical protein ABL907_03955 [Hyphomicrobium sp.]